MPLIFYFGADSSNATDQTKAFVYRVRDDEDDPTVQIVEILVSAGHDVMAGELSVEVQDGHLSVYHGRGAERQAVAKKFALPPLTVLAGVTSRLEDDGQLVISVPVKRN